MASGRIAADFGAAWHALDVSDAAPATKGRWRVASNPVKQTNFGGQNTTEIFGPAGRLVPSQYHAPTDDVVAAPYGEELDKVESAGKDPEEAWKDAEAAGRCDREAARGAVTC